MDWNCPIQLIDPLERQMKHNCNKIKELGTFKGNLSVLYSVFLLKEINSVFLIS